MRTSVRHVVLLLAGSLTVVAAILGVGTLVRGSRPASSSSSPPGSAPPPRIVTVEREGRLATPAPAPLCAQTAVARRGVPSERGEPPTPASSPASLGQLPVPILVYHYVRNVRNPFDVLGQRLSVTPEEFAAQMDLLRRSGAHAITLGDLVAVLRGDAVLPAHPVVLTFDDGYEDFLLNALPVLQRDRLCATLFAVPGFLGRASYLTEAQLREVAAAGVRIGAHTMDHLNLAVQPAPVVADQVSRSADALRALTGQRVHDFAYPYGAFNSVAVAAAQSAGFDDAVAMRGTLPETAAGRFTLPRREVIGGESLAQFAAEAGVASPAR